MLVGGCGFFPLVFFFFLAFLIGWGFRGLFFVVFLVGFFVCV